MAFVEHLPALLEPMAAVPQTWRGRLPDGTPVSVRRYPEIADERVPVAIARLRALAGIRHPFFLAPLGAAADAEGLAVIYPADLRRGLDAAAGQPVGPAAGLALAEDMLEGLAAVHATGQAHGALDESAIRLSYPEGEARIWAPDPLPPEEQGARAEDVRATAQLVCRALGLPLEWTPSDPLRDVERAAPALAATLRALARGSLPLDAAGAQTALREAAGGLADGEAAAAGRAALRDLAGGGAARRPLRPAPAAQAPAASRPLAPLEPGTRRLALPLAIVAGLLLLAAVGAISYHFASRGSPTGAAERPSPSPPASSPQPSARPSPSLPPAQAGDIQSVAEAAQGQCAVGSGCTVEVTVYFIKAAAPEDVSWQFQLVDGCTGEATYIDGNHVNAKTGWTHVIGDTHLTLPAGHPLSLIAVTITPSQAASSPLLVAGGTC